MSSVRARHGVFGGTVLSLFVDHGTNGRFRCVSSWDSWLGLLGVSQRQDTLSSLSYIISGDSEEWVVSGTDRACRSV